MTLDQLHEFKTLAGPFVVGFGWAARNRYGAVLRARATRDAEAIRDGTKK